MMVLRSLDQLDQRVRSRYEAVVVAAARARQMNAQKLAAEERGEGDAPMLKKAKVTTRALDELLNGEIEFERVEE